MPGGAGNGGPMALEVSLEIGPHEELMEVKKEGPKTASGVPAGWPTAPGK